jgi:hypothetical protein
VRAARTPFRPDRQQVLPLRSWSESPVRETAGSVGTALKVADVSMNLAEIDAPGELPDSMQRSWRSHEDTDQQMSTPDSKTTEPMAHAS